ncbi:MAG: hypothetical protein ABI091_20820 [Ferruginibacter sp.]
MTQQQENSYYESNLIIVQKQRLSDKSRCKVGKCKRAQTYTIFIGTRCALSTLYETSCPIHLAHQVDKTIKYMRKKVSGQIERAKKREIEEAQKLLNNTL